MLGLRHSKEFPVLAMTAALKAPQACHPPKIGGKVEEHEPVVLANDERG
jgi:hypothetical protein